MSATVSCNLSSSCNLGSVGTIMPSVPISVQWMWAEPKVTLFGRRSAQCNPLRWSAKKSLSEAVQDFNLLTYTQDADRPIRLRRGKVVTLYKNGADAKQALSARRGRGSSTSRPQVDDWVLGTKISGQGTKWFYVPELLSDKKDEVMAGRYSEKVDHTAEFVLARKMQKRGYRLQPGLGKDKHSMSAPIFEENGMKVREGSRDTFASTGMQSTLTSSAESSIDEASAVTHPMSGVLEEREDSFDNHRA